MQAQDYQTCDRAHSSSCEKDDQLVSTVGRVHSLGVASAMCLDSHNSNDGLDHDTLHTGHQDSRAKYNKLS